MTKLVCTDCQHENELERIYCHNCGARLDRTKIIKEKVEQASTPTQEHKSISKRCLTRDAVAQNAWPRS